MTYCAIDFGTSNSAIAISRTDADGGGMRLVPLEGQNLTMPTAVFYCTDADDLPPGTWRGKHIDDSLPRTFGRAAVQAYIDGYEGRLMRSMKSLLGSSLLEQTTDLGGGHSVRYVDVVVGYLRHLKRAAEAAAGHARATGVAQHALHQPLGGPAPQCAG